MTTVTEVFHGHVIMVEATDRGDGQYTWVTLIDGEHRSRSQARSFATDELAIADALSQTRMRVEHIIWRDTRAT